MVHRLVVSYGRPEDPEAFDSHYRETHAPLAARTPGLLRFASGHARPMNSKQDAPWFIAEMDFESEEAMMAGFATPDGMAVGRDLRNFATGGVTMAHFEVHEVPLTPSGE